MNPQIMIDLETLDTTADAVVISIGLVIFDLDRRSETHDNCILETYYAVLNQHSQIEKNRTISPDTLRWWMLQPTEARVVFDQTPQLPPELVINDVMNLIQRYNVNGIWGNGSDFDNAIMHSLMKDYKYIPWSHRLNRCFRTFRALYDPNGDLKIIHPTLIKHHALDDAIEQVYHMIEICNKFNIGP